MSRRRYTPPPPEKSPAEKAILIIVGIIVAGLIFLFKFNTGGSYTGGEGSSHKGGHYSNSATDNHYRSR